MGVMLFSSLIVFALCEYLLKKYKVDLGKKEWCIVFAWIGLTVFWFMNGYGVLDSGYHLIDDHEVYEIRADFSHFGFWGTMMKWLRTDLNIRFRFSYFLFRITECYLLGDCFKLWHIAQSVIAVLSLFTAYFFARRMQTPPWLSYLFAMAIFLGGGQSAVLWRLGPQECLGVLLFMLTLICLTYYAEQKRVFILSAILTFFLGGIKESFLILLPLLPILLLIMEIRRGKENSLKECLNMIKGKWQYWIVTYAIFAVDICIVIFRVGTNKIGYAGIDEEFGLMEYAKAIFEICRGSFGVYTLVSVIGVCFLFILIYIWRQSFFIKAALPKILTSLLIFGYILASQFVLYAKGGMYERYLIPATIGFAVFWIIDMTYLMQKIHIPFSYYSFFMIFLAIMLASGYGDDESARKYAQDGKNTTEMMDQIAEYKDLSPDIIVSLGYEMDVSASIYLQEKYGIKTVYNLNYSRNDGSRVYDGWRTDQEEKDAIEFDEAHMYLGYANEIKSEMSNHGLHVEDFSLYTYGDYALYVDKIFDDAKNEENK